MWSSYGSRYKRWHRKSRTYSCRWQSALPTFSESRIVRLLFQHHASISFIDYISLDRNSVQHTHTPLLSCVCVCACACETNCYWICRTRLHAHPHLQLPKILANRLRKLFCVTHAKEKNQSKNFQTINSNICQHAGDKSAMYVQRLQIGKSQSKQTLRTRDAKFLHGNMVREIVYSANSLSCILFYCSECSKRDHVTVSCRSNSWNNWAK